MITSRSPEWAATKRWIDERIEESRKQLENPACTETQAHQMRGKIAALREFCDAAESPFHPSMLNKDSTSYT